MIPGLDAGHRYALFPIPSSDFPVPCSRLDAVAHGGFPQDRAASLFPVP
ncbi:hypothetical protein [Moorena producens]